MLILAGSLFSFFMFLLFAVICGLPDIASGIFCFIDYVSFFMIIVPVLFFLIATNSGGIITGYIRSSFTKDYEYGKAELENIAAVAKNTIKVTLAAGVFSFIAGLIYCLAWMDFEDPALLSHIARYVAVSLISPLYAVMIGFFVFFPLRVWAENKIKTKDYKDF